ncbi:helix-turn-helix domain-containing protein [Achromobacter sp. GG226]|uniref:helix-turn-helix domain-containing protein n=1 Tax=Verticiella alkaliphila TaxID=2779529 RepID=UPI001C0CD2EF|nr:helix-turn-helix domain-containing protein [Verticiella sp. GG226]MBU4610535.1 helix-turn-helix domain-containing protein [Verticiella sp. GG226]
MLDVEDIAKLLHVSKKHIYNLSSAKKLPFKLFKSSDKMLVSIIEMAKYLDGPVDAVAEVVVRKRGRPAGSGKAKITLAFQAAISFSILKDECRQSLTALQGEFDNWPTGEGMEPPSINDFEQAVARAKTQIEKTFLSLSLDSRNSMRLPKA